MKNVHGTSDDAGTFSESVLVEIATYLASICVGYELPKRGEGKVEKTFICRIRNN